MGDFNNLAHHPRNSSVSNSPSLGFGQTISSLSTQSIITSSTTLQNNHENHFWGWLITSKFLSTTDPHSTHSSTAANLNKLYPGISFKIISTYSSGVYYAHVLDQDGKIRYKSTGYGDREKALQGILGVVKGEVKAKMKMEREMFRGTKISQSKQSHKTSLSL